ncbi:hypothetical protein D3C73_636840 [compost metagenome]
MRCHPILPVVDRFQIPVMLNVDIFDNMNGIFIFTTGLAVKWISHIFARNLQIL